MVEISEKKRSLERPKRIREQYKNYFKETGWEGVD
jgi:hypothetical protein